MRSTDDFEVVWAGLAVRLRRFCAAAGVPTADRDDVVQETGARLWQCWDTLDPNRPVEPFARTVALNVWRDSWRAYGCRESIGAVPELAAVGADVERTVLARLQLRNVVRELRAMDEADRVLIRDGFAAQASTERSPAERPHSAALRMARMRARKQLAISSGYRTPEGALRCVPAVVSAAN